MEKTDYLSEIKTPVINFSDVNNTNQALEEIEDYLKHLDVLRLLFVESLSSCRDTVALAYLEELVDVRKIIIAHTQGKYVPSTPFKHLTRRLPQEVLTNDILRNRILFGLLHSIERAIDFVRVIIPNAATSFVKEQFSYDPANDLQVDKKTPKQSEARPTSKLHKRLEDYGEFLSVKDICDIFGVTPRTVSNWEQKGILINVAEVSDEVNSIGRKKRGQAKKYRKDKVQEDIALQEKFNGLL